MQYTIQAVSQQTRAYPTRFGDMVSYKVMFEGVDTPVEISQQKLDKQGNEKPAPKVGDVVDGTIDMSGQYGPKFKKEYNQGNFNSGGSSFGQSSQGSGTTSRSGSTNANGRSFNSDPFTMYLSYAKDVAVASISDGKFNADLYAEVLEAVETGGKMLYGSRPGAEEKSTDVVPEKTSDEDMKKDIDDFFADVEEKPIDTSEIPF